MKFINTQHDVLVNLTHVVSVNFYKIKNENEPCVVVNTIDGKGYYLDKTIRTQDDFASAVLRSWDFQ